MLRVATWNLWWRFGEWERRQDAIAAELSRVDADIVGLQEVWSEEDGPSQAEILGERLGMQVTQTDQRFHRGLSFTNALLSRCPVSSNDSIRLPDGDGGLSHRDLLLATVDAPFGPILIAVTHIDYQFDRSRVRTAQLAAVAEEIAARRGDPTEGFPALLLGDLNAVPDSDEIRRLTGRSEPLVPGIVFTDSWEVAGDGSAGHTWSDSNPHLAASTWPRRRLDYVLVSWPRPKPLGKALSCRMFGTEPVDGVVPSDHYGVVADLTTPT